MVLNSRMRRRSFMLGGASLAAMLPLNAFAQQNVARIVVPFAAGGPADTIARLFVEAKLGDAVGRTLIVENKPGASGIIGTQMVARAPADGFTYLLMPTFFIQNAVAYEKPGYDPIKDFVAVAPIGTTYLVWAISGKHPANTMGEFVADARKRGEQVTFASPGVGTGNHLAGIALNQVAGLKMAHVPYRGEILGFQDVVSGHVTGGLFALSTVKPHLESGQIKVLAVMRTERQPELPNVPTIIESGFDHPLFRSVGWFGLFAPAATPPDIVGRVGKEVAVLIKKPEIADRLNQYGIRPWDQPPELFPAKLKEDYGIWKTICEQAGIKLTF